MSCAGALRLDNPPCRQGGDALGGLGSVRCDPAIADRVRERWRAEWPQLAEAFGRCWPSPASRAVDSARFAVRAGRPAGSPSGGRAYSPCHG